MNKDKPKGNYIHEAPRVTDWQTFGSTGIEFKVINPTGDWTGEQSPMEKQRNILLDSDFCVDFSAIRVITTLLNKMIETEEIYGTTLASLTEMGYIINGKFDFNETFTAKMSGNSPTGNTFFNVWESIRKDGLLPQKDWAQIENIKKWNDLMIEIPQELKDKAKKFLTILNPDDPTHAIQWERLLIDEQNNDKISKALLTSPIQIATPICSWSGDIIQPCGETAPAHATIILKEEPNAWVVGDTYSPFTKRLAKNFCIRHAVRAAINVKKTIVPQTTFSYEFHTWMVLGDHGEQVLALNTALKSIGLTNIIPNDTYSEQTRQAVKQFQISNGIQDNNGIAVRTLTLAALNKVFSAPPKPVTCVSGDEKKMSWFSRLLQLIKL